jgi:hypothetical protein
MSKFLQFFNLEKSFTKNNLDNAYNKKIKEIDQLHIPAIDKEYYKETAKNLYYKAQHHVTYDNNFNIPNNNFNIHNNNFNIPNNNFNIYSYQEVSSSKLNPDGSISVYKESVKNKNGDIKKDVQSYVQHKDGKIIPMKLEN